MGPCRQRCLQVQEQEQQLEEEVEQEPEKKVQEDIRPAASAINLCAKLSLCRMSFRGGVARGGGLEWGKAPLIQRAKKDVNSSQLVCKNWHK